MSTAISEKLLSGAIDAIKSGNLKDFKEAIESELLDFYEGRLNAFRLIELAASYDRTDIVDYVLGTADFSDISGLGCTANAGYCKSGNYDAFMVMLERIMPLMKEKESALDAENSISIAIQHGHVDMAKKMINAFSVKPYAECCQYRDHMFGATDHPYRRLISVCLKWNCIELLDELFEKANASKDEISFDKIIMIARALKRDDFIKKIEEWREKYPFQPKCLTKSN